MRAPEFWQRGGPVPALLAPLAWGYDALGHIRRAMARPRRVGCPVICIGNLVAGGAGKTPVALAVGALLDDAGERARRAAAAGAVADAEAGVLDVVEAAIAPYLDALDAHDAGGPSDARA